MGHFYNCFDLEISGAESRLLKSMFSFPGSSHSKESAYNAGDLGSILGYRRSPGGGNGYPLQYSCLRIPWTEEPSGLQSMRTQLAFTERLAVVA